MVSLLDAFSGLSKLEALFAILSFFPFFLVFFVFVFFSAAFLLVHFWHEMETIQVDVILSFWHCRFFYLEIYYIFSSFRP